MRRGQEQTWQMEPERLITSTVQVWSSSGSMLTAQCPLDDAQAAVREGRAFVISSQAIGHYDREYQAFE